MDKCKIRYSSQNVDSLFHFFKLFELVPNFWPSNKISMGMLEKKARNEAAVCQYFFNSSQRSMIKVHFISDDRNTKA